FAAPGGKTAYIAGLMQGHGEIVAVDRFESRLNILRQNIKRLGIECVKTVEADAMEFKENEFDRVIADVPCSGTGTLSKKPDIKWKRDLLDIQKLAVMQYNYLCKASELVKKDGILIYSTCSIEPEENFEVVKKFLENNPGFKLLNASEVLPAELTDENNCVQTLPHLHQIDGAFAAKLLKL
ncbi:MAG: RsmB/NOP family class I SAM-dependent RNA methyltransferase, partial [Ignavibacteria bacterium]